MRCQSCQILSQSCLLDFCHGRNTGVEQSEWSRFLTEDFFFSKFAGFRPSILSMWHRDSAVLQVNWASRPLSQDEAKPNSLKESVWISKKRASFWLPLVFGVFCIRGRGVLPFILPTLNLILIILRRGEAPTLSLGSCVRHSLAFQCTFPKNLLGQKCSDHLSSPEEEINCHISNA